MFDLMIIFRNGSSTILKVDKYGANTNNNNVLYFEKGKQRSFIPVYAALYFGEPIDFNIS